MEEHEHGVELNRDRLGQHVARCHLEGVVQRESRCRRCIARGERQLTSRLGRGPGSNDRDWIRIRGLRLAHWEYLDSPRLRWPASMLLNDRFGGRLAEARRTWLVGAGHHHILDMHRRSDDHPGARHKQVAAHAATVVAVDLVSHARTRGIHCILLGPFDGRDLEDCSSMCEPGRAEYELLMIGPSAGAHLIVAASLGFLAHADAASGIHVVRGRLPRAFCCLR